MVFDDVAKRPDIALHIARAIIRTVKKRVSGYLSLISLIEFAYHKAVSTPTSKRSAHCTHKSIFKHICATTTTPKQVGITENATREGNSGCDDVYGTNRYHQHNVYEQKVSHASRGVVWSFQEERNIRHTEGKYTSIYDCWNDNAYHP